MYENQFRVWTVVVSSTQSAWTSIMYVEKRSLKSDNQLVPLPPRDCSRKWKSVTSFAPTVIAYAHIEGKMAFDPVSSLLDVGRSLIERLIPDPTAKAAATQKLLEMQQSGDLAAMSAQMNVNAIEAANPRLFISGWRPAVGWVCAGALAFQLVLSPMIQWGSALAHRPVTPPVMQTELLTTMLISMLGMGGLRSLDKFNGVSTK
jgi:hypothetical protein